MSNGFPKGGRRNPFLTYDKLNTSVMDRPWEPFTASSATSQADIQKRKDISYTNPTPISLPPHLYIPEDAQSVDLRRLASVTPGTTTDLIRFTCPPGVMTNFIAYSIFCDALLFALVNFVPKVNGQRVFPFHGDPQANFKIGLGTGTDLSNANTIQCQLYLQPNDVLVWTFTNNDTVDVVAGIRMIGYVDKSTVRKTGRYGG
jgi:hypothetical protein